MIIDLILLNIVFAIGKICGNRRWDNQLRGISLTYDRTKYFCRSNTYKTLNRFVAIVHTLSLFNMILLPILQRCCTVQEINITVAVLSFSFIFDWPIHVLLMLKTNRRAKLWAQITKGKKKLTKIERKQIEEEFYNILRR